jgi:hypothetical protein
LDADDDGGADGVVDTVFFGGEKPVRYRHPDGGQPNESSGVNCLPLGGSGARDGARWRPAS